MWVLGMCGFAEAVGYGMSEWQCSTILRYDKLVKTARTIIYSGGVYKFWISYTLRWQDSSPIAPKQVRLDDQKHFRVTSTRKDN